MRKTHEPPHETHMHPSSGHHSCTHIATHTALDTPTHMFCRPNTTGVAVTPKRNALPSGCSSLWAAATRGQHISHAPDPHSVTSSSSLPPHLGNLDPCGVSPPPSPCTSCPGHSRGHKTELGEVPHECNTQNPRSCSGAPAAELLTSRALRTWFQMHTKQVPGCSLGVESLRPRFKPCLGPWHLWELRSHSQTFPHVTPLRLSFPRAVPVAVKGDCPPPQLCLLLFEWILFPRRISL